MRNVIHIIGKNLKLLLRSRSSALIIVIAPLLLILLLGLAFNNSNAFGLTIGVYSPTELQKGNQFLSVLEEQHFRIIVYKNETTCTEDIKLGLSNTCIVLPPDFNFDSNQQKTVTFHIDQSKINIVWMVMDTLNAQFGTNAREVTKNLAAVLVQKLESTKTELEAKQPVMAQIKTDTGEAQARVQTTDQGLVALDLSYNDNAFPIGEAKAKIVAVSAIIAANLDAAHTNISSVKSETNESKILSAVNDAIASIDSARNSLSGANTTGANFAEVDTLLTMIQTGLQQTKSKITQANTFKENTKPLLEEAKQRLAQTVANVDQVSGTISKILSDISSIKVTDPNAIAQPIITEIKPISTKSTYLNYLFPSLIVLVVMFIAIMLGTTLVMMEKNSPAYFRNFIAPTSDITFVMGTYLTTMLMVLIQLVIIVAISSTLFSTQLLSSLGEVAAVLLIAATFFAFWGMVIGYMFTSEETATLGAISTGSIFLLISNVIIPLESTPVAVREIAMYNPFVIAEKVLRQIILFQPKIQVIAQDLGVLASYAVVVFMFIMVSQKFMSKRYLQKILYYHHKKKREELQQRELEHLAAKEVIKEQQTAQPTAVSSLPTSAKPLVKELVRDERKGRTRRPTSKTKQKGRR